MRSSSLKVGGALLAGFLSAVVFVGNGCQTSGNEGDTCNPLVVQDECHSGLHCTQTTCTYAYCCPTSGSSNNPNCNFGGCPADDAGDEAGDDAAADDASSDGEAGIEDGGGD